MQKSALQSSINQSISPVLRTEPSDEPGLQVWLDMSDTTTITPARGVVSSARSKVNGYNFNTSTQRPNTGLATLNGLNVLTFNNQGISTALAVAISNPRTIFVVVQRTAGFGATHRVFWTAGNQGELNLGSGTNICTSSNNAISMTRAQTDNIYNIISVVQNGTNSVLGVNGGEQVGTVGTNAINNILWVGHDLTNRLRGNIAELLVYNGVLGLTARSQIVNTLKAKWLI